VKQQRIRDAENGGIRADADGQRKNYDTREARIFQERANGEAKILEQRVHGGGNRSTAYLSRVRRMSCRRRRGDLCLEVVRGGVCSCDDLEGMRGS